MTQKAIRTGIFAGVFAVILACALMIVTQTSYADGANGLVKYGKKMTVSDQVYCTEFDLGSKAKGAKDIVLKSSNKKVAAPMDYYKEENLLMSMIGKKGTAKLTFKVKKKSGTKTYKGTLKVVSYKNPVKKFTLEGKNITKKFKKSTYLDYEKTKTKGKISVKAAKGWKVKKIMHGYLTTNDKYVFKKVKNNSTIKWSKTDTDQLFVYMYKKSKNQYEMLIITPYAEY